eukprot:948915-Rhodomonas_salina.2
MADGRASSDASLRWSEEPMPRTSCAMPRTSCAKRQRRRVKRSAKRQQKGVREASGALPRRTRRS